MLRSSGLSHRSDGYQVESYLEEGQKRPEKWSFGILNDRETDEVPGSVLLMSRVSDHNEPLGLRNAPARTSASSLPSPYPPSRIGSIPLRLPSFQEKKRTKDGNIVLEPQPEESMNDPLNWPTWRRDVALFSLGFYCMLGGGMTPVLAAGFNNVAATYKVTVPQVALTTGLYMMGLGIGSVVASPTAILFGKRPVYLVTAIVFLLTSVWCALSPNYPSLVIARIVMGIAVSPVECLPSATVAEIFFLHERAYRLGIYTLLLLGGKNLVPLVSAAIIQSLGWRWVFWIVAIVVGFGFSLLFLFVPETFWDRTPRPHKHHKKVERPRIQAQRPLSSSIQQSHPKVVDPTPKLDEKKSGTQSHPKVADTTPKPDEPEPKTPKTDFALQLPDPSMSTLAQRRTKRRAHFGDSGAAPLSLGALGGLGAARLQSTAVPETPGIYAGPTAKDKNSTPVQVMSSPQHQSAWKVEPKNLGPKTPELRNLNSPFYQGIIDQSSDYFSLGAMNDSKIDQKSASAQLSNIDAAHKVESPFADQPEVAPAAQESNRMPDLASVASPVSRQTTDTSEVVSTANYTKYYRSQPRKSFLQTLKPFSGRLCNDSWLRVAFRPFVLFAYPAILWSTMVYSLSVGWLIVLSESVSSIYRDRASYNFSALQTGLVYLSPFIGGVLGTAVAGKVSDLIVRWMARRNGGIYEPEFRLVMALPVALCTTVGLMGYGWSSQERDAWIVPTVFFGIISFGCSLGSTTAITFAVDSYRQYAGEALVTLNFSKNVFHGLVFSLFFNRWLEHDGAKTVFIALGGIQMACLLFSIPMYIYGKRARMWTVRKNLMEKF
ncbi:hypothetical protein LTR66_005064 [Elasticomyces elasticus]|nr:hypothetical protein LTR66_005064 [Elasticomyces elasticus]